MRASLNHDAKLQFEILLTEGQGERYLTDHLCPADPVKILARGHKQTEGSIAHPREIVFPCPPGAAAMVSRRLSLTVWAWLTCCAALCLMGRCAALELAPAMDAGPETHEALSGLRQTQQAQNASLLQIPQSSRPADTPSLDRYNLPDYEIQALHELFSTTDGDNWQWRNIAVFGPMWIFVDGPEPCVGPWQGITCTTDPDNNNNLHVTNLALIKLGLSGTLPPVISQLPLLVLLSLAENDLYGSIPSDLGQLRFITAIDFTGNRFSGELPAALSDCTSLETLVVSNNSLTGTIPEGLNTLPALVTLDVTHNLLSGPLPPWLGTLRRVITIGLGLNYFSGTIPESYDNLTHLAVLRLGGNFISGTIPASLVGLPKIREFELSLNQLVGKIPSWLGEVTTLLSLFLDNNHFTGTILEALTQLEHLEILNLEYNGLTGTIPSSLSTPKKLKILKVNGNLLHGQIPSALTNASAMEALDVSLNHLTGSIPPELGRMAALTFAALNDNLLTGTLPVSLGNLSKITVINVADNQLHGTLPPGLGGLKRLSNLYVHDNFLTGTLPPEFSNLEDLVTLFAQNNSLRGSLDGVFNATRQRKVTLIELGSNELTGTVPDEIFSLPNLLTLALVENCFSGARLDLICDCQNLSTVILDGLRSAPKCRDEVLPGISNAYVLTTKPLGTVPPCLFSMPNLNTLHLSSNSLTGSLPKNISIASALFDLSLSHNKLTSTIPAGIQNKFWFNLDLSYNKFGGGIDYGLGAGFNSTDFEDLKIQLRSGINSSEHIPPSALSLRNNRLSDRVPASLSTMLNISVLSGNLFTCNTAGNDLPEHDSGRASYHCGSETFDRSYYLWVALVASLGVGLLLLVWWLRTVPTTVRGAYYASLACSIQSWYSFTTWYVSPDLNLKMNHYKRLLSAFDAVCRAACWATLAILVVMLPVYGAARAHYGTHSHEYAWSVSAAFLSGYPALGLLLAAFVVFLAVVTVLFRRQLQSVGRDQGVRTSLDSVPAAGKSPQPSSFSYQAAGLYVLYFVVNFAVSFGANALYVSIILRENSKYFVSAQIGLSVFKVCWNSIGAVRLARWTWQQVVAIRGAYARQDSSFFALQLFVGLSNYIAIPCLVVGVISPDCFNTLFVNQADISSTYFYQSCAVFGRTACVKTNTYTAKTSFVPPFTYSYQCSSSLITYYAASFVYMALIVTFVNPAVNLFLRWVYVHRHAVPWCALRIERMCPMVLRDLTGEIGTYNAYRPYFDGSQRIVEVMTYFGVMLTFGLVFPPLAAAMLVAIISPVAAMKVKIGRFLTAAIDAGQPFYLRTVDSECKGVASPRMLRICAMQLLCFTCFFFTLFLFDTLSDAVGATQALWVVVIVPLFPALIFAGNWLAEKWSGEQGGVPGGVPAVAEDLSAAEQRGTEVEMSNVEAGAGGVSGEAASVNKEEDGVATLSALHTAAAGGESPC